MCNHKWHQNNVRRDTKLKYDKTLNKNEMRSRLKEAEIIILKIVKDCTGSNKIRINHIYSELELENILDEITSNRSKWKEYVE